MNILVGLLGLLLLLLLLTGGRGSLLCTLLLDGDLSLVLAVLLDEVGEVLDGSRALVSNGSVLGTSGVELDGRETLDLIGDVVQGGVNLGDDNLVLELRSSVLRSKVIVLGSESLAVTTPGSVKLNKDILGVIKDDIVVALGNNNCDGTLLGLGDGLRLDAGLNLASVELLNELGDVVVGDLLLLVEGELLVLDNLLDGERGELVGLEVQVTSVGTESLSIDGGEVDLALVLLCDRLESLAELLALLLGLREDVSKGDTSGHVTSVCLRANLTNEGSSGSRDESRDGLLLKLLCEGVLALIESLVDNQGGGLDTLSLGNSGVVDATEEVGVTETLSKLGEGLVGALVIGVEVSNDNDLVGGLELLEGVLCEDGNSGEGLLDHIAIEVDLPSSLALTGVGSDILKATEDLEGGVTLNAVLLAEVRLLSAVNLGEPDVLLLEGSGSLLVFGGKGLAVTAPGSENYGGDKIVGLDELVKCVLGKLANIGVGSRGIGSQSSHKAAGDLLVVHDGLSGWGYPRKHKERASL
ncbi:hypothetical protein HG531_013413 [Fusarium graminearum]|nr:hypothetical protein HG531_013413 [Fusarium graminearum]